MFSIPASGDGSYRISKRVGRNRIYATKNRSCSLIKRSSKINSINFNNSNNSNNGLAKPLQHTINTSFPTLGTNDLSFVCINNIVYLSQSNIASNLTLTCDNDVLANNNTAIS